eukprot:10500870-Karenia_brevis.AAC.1
MFPASNILVNERIFTVEKKIDKLALNSPIPAKFGRTAVQELAICSCHDGTGDIRQNGAPPCSMPEHSKT